MSDLKMSELLNKFRDILGQSQKEVADNLEVPAPSLSFYENDRRIPPLDVLIMLLDFYDAKLFIETDLGKWKLTVNEDDEVRLIEKDKSEEVGLLSGLDDQEKEDLVSYIRRRRRNTHES